MIDSVRARRPAAKIIAFAKGAGILLKDYRQATGADAIGLDWSVPLSFAAELQKDGPVQGNLDPMRVVAGGRSLDDGIDAILQALGNGPLIFNLGHGITPQAESRPRHAAGRPCPRDGPMTERQTDIRPGKKRAPAPSSRSACSWRCWPGCSSGNRIIFISGSRRCTSLP